MSDFLNKQIFLRQLESLIEVFPTLKSKNRIDRIFWFMKDLPENGFVEIFNSMIDNFKFAPTPNDFHEASVAWKKKNNFYQKFDVDYVKVDCDYCNDTGIVLSKNIYGSENNLMRCDCSSGLENDKKLPQWSSDLRQAFQKTKCPLEWFKPEIDQEDSDKKLVSKIWSKLEAWQLKILNSEKYWMNLGYKSEN